MIKLAEIIASILSGMKRNKKEIAN